MPPPLGVPMPELPGTISPEAPGVVLPAAGSITLGGACVGSLGGALVGVDGGGLAASVVEPELASVGRAIVGAPFGLDAAAIRGDSVRSGIAGVVGS